MFFIPKKIVVNNPLARTKKNSFEIIEVFLIISSSLVFFIMFLKTFCFVSNMKNWVLLGDFQAQIKNRKAMRNAKEKKLE